MIKDQFKYWTTVGGCVQFAEILITQWLNQVYSYFVFLIGWWSPPLSPLGFLFAPCRGPNTSGGWGGIPDTQPGWDLRLHCLSRQIKPVGWNTSLEHDKHQISTGFVFVTVKDALCNILITAVPNISLGNNTVINNSWEVCSVASQWEGCGFDSWSWGFSVWSSQHTYTFVCIDFLYSDLPL